MGDLDKLLRTTLREFVEMHRSELPRYIVVGEDATFKNIVNVLRESVDHGDKGVEVVVVVDKDQKPIGIIEDLELIEIFSSHSRWSLSILKPPIRRRARGPAGILNVPIGRIARMNSPILKYDSTIKDALDLMDSFKSRYIIVIDDKERLYGVVSSRNLLSKILNELVED